MRGCGRAVAVLLATALAGSAAADEGALDALAAWKQDLLSVLVLRADANHLAGAALLARSSGDADGEDRARQLLARAARSEPDNPLVSWLQLADCEPAIGACPNAQALARLREVDDDNAAVWLLSHAEAARNGDRAAREEALERAATARRYDDYAGPVLQALSSAVSALPVPPAAIASLAGTGAGPSAVRVFIAYGEANTLPGPSFLPLMEACEPRSRAARRRGETCAAIADRLAWGSSPSARAAGLHLQEVLATDAPAREKARQRLHDLAWQVGSYSRLVLAAFGDEELATRLLRLGQGGGSEMSRVAASLHQAGIPLANPEPLPPAPEADLPPAAEAEAAAEDAAEDALEDAAPAEPDVAAEDASAEDDPLPTRTHWPHDW